MCLLPLFLVPIVNLLPLLFDLIMVRIFTRAKIYAMFGWEYRKPERAPPACPYKPAARKDDGSNVLIESLPGDHPPVQKPVEVGNGKED
ncbi:unnamed protein product [Linum tenue]|uniref:Transmembrane protein n=1 Tax=Linum tenue TaxID=586396 RepID=A0AAV0PDU5_9ROSI|nr:unnamed protein product [Linum tenue]